MINDIKVALCCIAKNENPYIREWVEYYKNIGISKIFIYDNNDINGERFEDVIEDYISNGYVEIIDIRGKEKGLVYINGINLQLKCYFDCYNKKCKEYDWVCFFDVDEFLSFRNGYDLKSYLNQKRMKYSDTVLVGWEIYDDNNQMYYENKPVLERFNHKSALNYSCIKSIVRTNRTLLANKEDSNIHIIRVKESLPIRANYKKYTNKSNFFTYKDVSNHDCYLKHIKTKSAEEFIKRHYHRHWGTEEHISANQLGIDDVKKAYFKYCEYTKEKSKKFDEISLIYIQKTLEIKSNNKIVTISNNINNNKSSGLKVAVCAIAKNENLYIREWVEWYKNLGISKIFLYDNNDIDGEYFEDVINDYIESGFVEIIDRRGVVKNISDDQDGQTLQGLSYKDCYDSHYKEYDWICFFDIDEFLEIDENLNLYTFLNLYKDNKCDGIHIQWKMYGDNNLLYYDNRGVIERFRNKKNESKSSFIKSILKCKEHHKDNITFCAHGPLKISGRYKQIDIINVDFSQALNPYRNKHELLPDMPAYLLHFYCKSTEEFINRKWKKTSAVTGININRNYDINFLKDQYFKHTSKTAAKLQLFDNLINEKYIYKKQDANDRIIVNFTTWTKRDMYVPFLLKYFKNQTLYPDEIICWLSEDEYHGIISQSIQYCLDNHLLTQVKFVKGNIYGHKRYETFKYNLDAYNILIDDDIYYPIDYVEQLYKTSKENPDDVVCYYSRKEIYEYNGKRSFTDIDENPSYSNRYFSGLSIFYPYLFPIEIFKYSKIRDKYCQKCDDSWINAWLFKKNIKIRAIKNWGNHSPLNVIGSTQEDGIYETHNGLKINGIMQAAINIANAITLTNTQDIAKELWPDFNINEVTTYNK